MDHLFHSYDLVIEDWKEALVVDSNYHRPNCLIASS